VWQALIHIKQDAGSASVHSNFYSCFYLGCWYPILRYCCSELLKLFSCFEFALSDVYIWLSHFDVYCKDHAFFLVNFYSLQLCRLVKANSASSSLHPARRSMLSAKFKLVMLRPQSISSLGSVLMHQSLFPPEIN